MNELMPLIERLAEINGNLGGLLSILIAIVALVLAIPLIPVAVSRLRSREQAEEHPALLASRAFYAERCRRYGYAPAYAYYYREGALGRRRGW